MVPLPTPRLLALALGAALLLGAGSLQPWALALAAVYLACLGALLLADLRFCPPASSFTLRRLHESRLSLGEPNPIDLQVAWTGPHAPGGRPLRVWVRDESPPEIAADRQVLEGALAPGGRWTGRYRLSPVRRGDYRFGAAYLRVESPLGLLIRQHSYPLAGPVQVYPNLRALRRYELLARQGRLQEVGLRHSRLFGAGTQFERLRDYQPDDDYRRVAWKATARRQRPVTVEYETERSQNLILILDTGRLMGAPVGPMQKLDYAVNAALMLAYVAVRMDERVGLLAFADRVELYVPPGRGRRQFHLLLETLYKVGSQPVESDPGRALAFLAARQPRRSLVALFTDLEESTEAARVADHLGVLARHHLPLCITIADPGLLRLASAPPSDSRQAYERVVAQRLLDERRAILDRLERRGTIALDVPAEKLTAALVNRYMELKARTRL